MAYNELIKNFDKIRDYIRDFYVYGFRTRTEFDQKSQRSYDNERRRLESWLGDVMAFRQDASGKSVIITVDSRTIPHNPLFKAFKAKSFTDKDIVLHFYIMDCLADGEKHTVREISEYIYESIASVEPTDGFTDDATVRNKLREYVQMGLILSEKKGRELVYFRNDVSWDPEAFLYAISFSSEVMPLGVVGATFLDKYETVPDDLSYKHHFLFSAFESEVLEQLVQCRKTRRKAEIHYFTRRSREIRTAVIYPLHVFINMQDGRENLLAYNYEMKQPYVYRLDRIRTVKMLEEETYPQKLDFLGKEYRQHLWGVSSNLNSEKDLDHVEMLIRVYENEDFIINRLRREKRCGSVAQVDAHTWKFEADVCDAKEMLPWIRTFTGRILSIHCSNPEVENRFYGDLSEMMKMYGV